MRIDAAKLIAAYSGWLAENTKFTASETHCEFTTPFLDRHNDRLQFYVVPEGDAYKLTDGGHVITDLKLSGCDLATDARKKMLDSILNGFGVSLEGDEITVVATPREFPRKKHMLLQAMLAVDDMFMIARHSVQNLFADDVRRFLDSHGVRYSPSVEFKGKSGYSHQFDYLIPKSASMPERVVKAMNHPTKTTVGQYLFAWTDTKDTRPSGARAYAILNDTEKRVPSDVISSLAKYEVHSILWSQRELQLEKLAA